MTKKILLSVAASALLTTSAFAGAISTDRGHANITEESYLQNGMDVINFASFAYVADINFNGAGSISDPLIKIDISNLEFPRFDRDNVAPHNSVAGDNSAERFDEHGKGIISSALANNGTDDLEQHFRFGGQVVYLVDVGIVPLNESPFAQFVINADSSIPLDNILVDGSKVELLFDGDDSQSIIHGHTYVMSMSPTEIISPDIDFKYVKGNQIMSLRTFSQTLDNNFKDEANLEYSTTFPPQFKVNCVRKFDGLINFENDRTTFVNPEHGDRIGAVAGAIVDPDGAANGADVNSDTVIDRDRMVFTIWNERDGSDATRYMGGHGTEYSFDVSNNDNLFPAATGGEWNYNVKTLTGNNQDTLLAEDVAGTTVAFAANTFTVTHSPDIAIPAGLTTYQLDLVSLDGETPIRPVVFSNPLVDLEGALTPNNIDTEDTSTITEVNHGIAAPAGDVDNNFITNADSGVNAQGRGDSPDVIVPQMDGSNTSDVVGEWMDHAYMAQIPATIAHADLKNKIYITNRSCVPVTPIFKLVLDGVVTKVTDVTPRNETETAIARDTQEVYNLADIITKAGTASTGTYSLEVILPGIAEDFYIYAQSKNTVINQFKDLPVYNTSNRD